MITDQHDARQLFLAIGRLEGKVDSLLTLSQKLEAEVSDMDQRLRTLEHSRHFLMGISAVIGAVASVAVAIATRLFSQ